MDGWQVRVRLLGPVELDVAGQPVRLGAQLRAMLAALAVANGRALAKPRLIELLWGEPAPAAAAATLRSHVLHLRRVLEPPRPPGQRPRLLVTEAGGYALRLAPDQLDATVFERLLALGRQAMLAGDPTTATARLADALALWHGDPLSGMADRPFAVHEAARLAALRTAARQLRVEAELAVGNHHQVLDELDRLLDADRTNERLRAQLAVALYRCHRPDAAAEVCADGLRVAADRGLDAPALRALQTDILRRRPDLDWTLPPRPFQLPPDTGDFTGRQVELAVLADVLAGLSAGRRDAVPICAVDGKPGVGKSALAVRAGHQLAARFPDGALYVDLRGAGADAQRLAPIEVLGRFLRALGVPDQPALGDVDAAAATLRSAVAGRRLLVVLDNAADAAQVRPLLPASPGCAVLVTSRGRLVDLDGAHWITLDLLGATEAVTLLGRLAGPDRVAADPDAARAVVDYCGLLPLAVRIAGARLRARQGWTVATFAKRLADQRRRLAELAAGDLAVQSSFQLSYRALDPADASLFRLVGLLDLADLPVGPVAALAGSSAAADAEAALERLVDAQLLETTTPGRYRFHDLLRLFARQLAEATDDPATRLAAVHAALAWYAEAAEQARSWLMRTPPPRPGSGPVAIPRFTDEHEVLSWLDLERANIVTAARQAAAAAPAEVAEVAWRLEYALVRYFDLRKSWPDWNALCQAAIDAAASSGRPRPEGVACRHLAMVCLQQGRLDDAVRNLKAAVELLRAAGDRSEETKTLCDLGIMHAKRREFAPAAGYFEQAVAAAREIGERRLEANALNNLGLVKGELGRLAEAVDLVRETLAIFTDIGERIGQSNTHESLGVLYRKQGRYAEALASYRTALAIARDYGDRYHEALALRGIGQTVRDTGDVAAARAYWQQALAIFVEMAAPEAAGVESLLAASG